MAQGRGEFGYGSMNKQDASPFGDPEQISKYPKCRLEIELD